MGGSFGVRCKLSASQGAALHLPTFYKRLDRKFTTEQDGAGAADLMCLCVYRLPQGSCGMRKCSVLSEEKRNLSAKIHFY